LQPTESSGDLLPPSPPAEKATAREDQAGKASADNGAGYGGRANGHRPDAASLTAEYVGNEDVYGV
jgi:hypothetical protein